MLRVGIIGLGDIAHIHVPLINKSEKVKLVAICDIDESKRDFVKDVNFYTNYEEMVEKENLDIVHVCLPHYLHYPVTKFLVENNVHVLQEKPLTLDYKEALKAIELSKNTDAKIAVCFQNRRNASVIKLLEMVASEDYGKVKGVKGLVAWARPKAYYEDKCWRGTWKYAGGGAMINQSIHTLDIMQLVGKNIISVTGSTSQLLDYEIEVEDTVVANIEFENDVKGFYMATNANVVNDSVEIKVYLEKAELTIRNSKLYITDDKHDELELIEDATLGGPKSYYGASHEIIFEEFYDAVINDTDDYVTVEDAAVSIKMIDAIHISSKEKRKVKMEEV
ncbi:MAG: Gfo/Idh/MocA family oxidoreductase [Erysipelothrix sp.]|nr:Gfo/Idh/MocA family oxidoreductase [Erysipelothrix sp.]